jgi:Lon protease-like protein
MIQPREPDPADNRGAGLALRRGEEPPLYRMGCAGRIASFGETEDGRYMLTLTGLCRFEIAEEMTPLDGYRRVLADYHRFRRDLTDEADTEVDRSRLMAALKRYFVHREISADWKAIEAAADDRLITSLAMTCPFAPSERQALLEAPTLTERARTMTLLLEMAVAEDGSGSSDARN